jgi:glycosyltransferase involved in cell wall biosynthesis
MENIGPTLSRLTWAKDIVVVDSGSTDETVAILARFPQVRVFNRTFDTHGNQWHYAVQETAIRTPWIWRLDADYQVTDDVLQELHCLDPSAPVDAYRIAFDYAIFSRCFVALSAEHHPVATRPLLRTGQRPHDVDCGRARQALKARIIHDDGKPTEQRLAAQGRYMRRELQKLRAEGAGLSSWLRYRPSLMPIAVFLHCLFAKGLFLSGRAGLFYALQRLVAEGTLSLMVLEEKLREQAERRLVSDNDGGGACHPQQRSTNYDRWI